MSLSFRYVSYTASLILMSLLASILSVNLTYMITSTINGEHIPRSMMYYGGAVVLVLTTVTTLCLLYRLCWQRLWDAPIITAGLTAMLVLVGFLGLESFLMGRSFDHTHGLTRSIRLRDNGLNQKRIVRVPDTEWATWGQNISKREFHFDVDEDGYLLPNNLTEKTEYKIVFIGGSTTECKYVSADKRFPYLTAKLLTESTSIPVAGFNAGVAGNHSMHTINLLLNRILQNPPDMIVFMHNINDLVTHLNLDSYHNHHPGRSLIQIKPWGHYNQIPTGTWMGIPYITNQINNRIQHNQTDEFQDSRDKDFVYDQDKIAAAYVANLKIFIEICNAHNITPVLMTQPTMLNNKDAYQTQTVLKTLTEMGHDAEKLQSLFNYHTQLIKALSHKEGVLCIDLAAYLSGQTDLFYDTHHFNDKGSERIANYLNITLGPVIEQANSATNDSQYYDSIKVMIQTDASPDQ